MDKINIFGGTGFIGSKFCELYPDQVIINDRDDYKTKSDNVLYFISTIDNYNVHKDLVLLNHVGLIKIRIIDEESKHNIITLNRKAKVIAS